MVKALISFNVIRIQRNTEIYGQSRDWAHGQKGVSIFGSGQFVRPASNFGRINPPKEITSDSITRQSPRPKRHKKIMISGIQLHQLHMVFMLKFLSSDDKSYLPRIRSLSLYTATSTHTNMCVFVIEMVIRLCVFFEECTMQKQLISLSELQTQRLDHAHRVDVRSVAPNRKPGPMSDMTLLVNSRQMPNRCALYLRVLKNSYALYFRSGMPKLVFKSEHMCTTACALTR